MRIKYAVDKIEENIAELENLETGEHLYINVKKLPAKVKEQDVLVYISKKYVLDNKEKEERKRKINKKFEQLREKSN
ncbi:MAG: DUF3006 domain-containing protein [Bacilli bacterium]|nr:DUF3006 domain-containing protein [Bacilli bacterium]MBQ3468858.1 DUF3006 domain-containing protein [Bacilli bacterium]